MKNVQISKIISLSVLASFFVLNQLAAPQAYAATAKTTMVKKTAAASAVETTKAVPKTAQLAVKSGLVDGLIDPNIGPAKIKVLSPAAGAQVSGSFDIKVDARGGGGATQVKIDYNDGVNGWKLVGISKTAAGTVFTIPWNSSAAKDGDVNFSVGGDHKDGSTSFVNIKVTVKNGMQAPPPPPQGDKTPPTIKILSPTPNQILNLGKIQISADAQDNDAIDRVEFFGEANVNVGSKQAAPYDITWDTNATNTQQGLATIRAVAYDKSGNSAEAKVMITLENPLHHSVKITPTPGDGATVKGKFSVTADCSPTDNVDHVNFNWQGQSQTVNGGNPYQFDLDVSGKPDGDIEVLMVAMDKNNTYLGEKQVTYHIQNVKDNTPPQVSITSPSNGESVSGNNVMISADVTDDVALDHVVIMADGNGPTIKFPGPYNYVWDTTKFKDGPVTIRVVALDMANNDASKEITVKVENDAMAPLCEITAPQDGEEVKGDVLVKVNASDDKALDNVQIYPNYMGGIISGVSLQNPPYEMTWDSTKFQDGETVPIVAVAVDKAGHETKSQTVRVKILNNPWHQITFDIKPAPESPVSGIVRLQVTCRPDDSKVDYVEFGGGGTKVKGGNPFEYEWDTTKEMNGMRGFTISAFDKQGTQLGAQSYNWDVQN